MIRDYMEEKDSACDPPLSWWFTLVALDAIAIEISAVVRRLQGLKTLLVEQADMLSFLIGTLFSLRNVEGPLDENTFALRSSSDLYVTRCKFSSTLLVLLSIVATRDLFLWEPLIT